MQFAVFEGARVQPRPKLRGQCPGCGAEVIAKCGNHVIWHWAHASRQHCDPWWENEGEWHRNWKNQFPQDWQEVPLVDQRTGERHFADVRTPGGLVIEFQRSTIHPEEVRAREAFYQKMVWVVDGCKNDADRYYFAMMRSNPNANGLVQFDWFGRSTLFKRWHTTKPVFIDFGTEQGFWRILRFDPQTKRGLAGLVDVAGFVQLASADTTDSNSVGGPAST